VGPLSESSGAMCNGYHPLDSIVFRLVLRELHAFFEAEDHALSSIIAYQLASYNSSLLEFLYIKSI